MRDSIHRTVLLNETIEGLNLAKDSLVVDGTFGGGGHSLEICRKYPGTKIIAFDQDGSVFEKSKDKFGKFNCDIAFITENFRNVKKVLANRNILEVDGMILDLGLSSDQLESSGRGFSFLKNEPLLMTMKDNLTQEDLTARDIVNNWEEKSLSDIIYGYGEEKFAKRIAKGIVEARVKRPIETTHDLSEIISNSVPAFYRRGKIHFATRTFQALRIAVNDELGALSEGLTEGFDSLKSGGRIAVISFHSLEDRVVKIFFKQKEKEGTGKLINKKPITPTVSEITSNPRARSAKLRILEKIK